MEFKNGFITTDIYLSRVWCCEVQDKLGIKIYLKRFKF